MSVIKCDKCLKTFSSQKTLQIHQDKYHTIKIDIQKTELSNELLTIDNQILKFNNNQIKYFIHNNEIYFKAKDIAKILGYDDPKDAVKNHVLEKDKYSVSYLKGGFDPPLDEKNKKILEQDHPQTIYINESGLYSLILGSKKPEAKEFKHWITSEVLPSIRKTGEYKINNMITYDNTSDNTNDNTIETEIAEYTNKDCVYILHIKENIYKYGYSSDLETRLTNHMNKLNYDKKIKFYILDNINQAKQLEKQIKYYLRKYKLSIKYENQTEIFKTDNINNVIENIDKFYESIKSKNIKSIEYNDDDSDDDTITEKYKRIQNEELKLEFEKEKTKQILSNNDVMLQKEKTRQLELEIEFYKLKNNI